MMRFIWRIISGINNDRGSPSSSVRNRAFRQCMAPMHCSEFLAIKVNLRKLLCRNNEMMKIVNNEVETLKTVS